MIAGSAIGWWGIDMHALVITFQSATPPEQLAEALAAYGRALASVPGLSTKTWLRDGAILGAFHLFASRRAAEAYLNSELVADLTANPAFTRFRIEHYVVLEELNGPVGNATPVGA